MGSFISSALCTVVATTYPVYASFKAIESDHKDDDTAWLIYWVIYSLFALAESILDTFIFWIPFYYEMKLAFLVALQFPQLRLPLTIYNVYVRPFLKQNEKKIDSAVSEATEKLTEQAQKKFHEVATTAGPKLISAVLNAQATTANKDN